MNWREEEWNLKNQDKLHVCESEEAGVIVKNQGVEIIKVDEQVPSTAILQYHCHKCLKLSLSV